MQAKQRGLQALGCPVLSWFFCDLLALSLHANLKTFSRGVGWMLFMPVCGDLIPKHEFLWPQWGLPLRQPVSGTF